MTTRPCCSSMPGWSSSSGFSWARTSGATSGRQPASVACGPAASTMTWKMSATPPATIPFSRCSAIFPLAIILKKMPSTMPGIFSPRRSACPRRSSGSRCLKTMTRPSLSGKRSRTCPRVALSGWGKRTTSGPWAIPAPAALVRRSISTRALRRAAAGPIASSAAIATVSWRYGTWCSCSSIGVKTAA